MQAFPVASGISTRYLILIAKHAGGESPMGDKSRIDVREKMTGPVSMVELWRGGLLESNHLGHAVICGADGEIIQAWGDPTAVIFPRSSCKMLQALPLIESGAAEAAGLTEAQLALSCASHQGAAIHTEMVTRWLADMGMAEPDLRCGSHWPENGPAYDGLVLAGKSPCQIHNNCSGKHTGFLTLNRHLKAGSEYTEADHPLQKMILAAFEETTGESSPGFGIDGCSAPNFATSVQGLARAMAFFAAATDSGTLRQRAAHRLTRAMASFPELIDGEGGADTDLMRAMGGRVTTKGGADGVYIAIIPEKRLGIAVKIMDGAARAKEAAITALLVHVGSLAADHPVAQKRLGKELRNWRGLRTGELRLSPGFV
jgi:L-asparaginase II